MGVDYNKLWEEISSLAVKENESLPEEKSLQDLMEDWKLSKGQTEYRVNKLVKEGKLSKRWVAGKNYYKPIAE